jgi:hypothetical protein
MDERIAAALDEAFALNARGEIRNLLITGASLEFRFGARMAVREWAQSNNFNHVEIDERREFWIPKIRNRELFDRLNQPNTVLVVKNYSSSRWVGEDTPRAFVRDLALRRHYGCGNDFWPSDELPNLRLVVAINDRFDMHWSKRESDSFAVVYEDESRKVWVDTTRRSKVTGFHPVLSAMNRGLFSVSEDLRTVIVPFAYIVKKHAMFDPSQVELAAEMVHRYLEENTPEFCYEVECLIFKPSKRWQDSVVTIDAERLRSVFPNMKTVLHSKCFDVRGGELCIMDAQALGALATEKRESSDCVGAELCEKWSRFLSL